jgi:hypothetical protein
MKIFLRGRKLWHYVSREIVVPKPLNGETEDKFRNRLENWDSVHNKIIFWFINTLVPSIHSLLPKQRLLGIF